MSRAAARRYAKAVGAILTVRPKTPWVLVGALGVLTGVFILSYYAAEVADWLR